MLTLDQRPSGIWRIRGTHHGVRIDQSARTRSKTEARAILKQLEVSIFADVHGVALPGQASRSVSEPTFGDAAALWLEAGGNSTLYFYFDTVIHAIGDTALSDITNGYLHRQARKLFPTQSASTINRGYFALASVIMTHAAEEKLAPPIKIRKLKTEKSAYEWYEPERIEALITAAGPMAPLITFCVASGARTSEVMSLTWGQVGLDGRRIVFWKTKGGRVRSFDLCARGRAALPERGADDVHVWLDGNGEPYSQSPDKRYYGPKRRLDRLTKRVGLPRTSIRSFRHTWATWQYSVNPDLLKLQEKGGWSTVAMVQNYTHVASPEIKKRVLDHGWFQD